MKRICIICGKEAKIEDFCEICWLKQKSLFDIENLELKVCKCNSWLDKNNWKRFKNLDEIVKDIIKNRIKTENRIIEKNIELKRIGNKYSASIECKGYIYPSKTIKTEKKTIVVKIKKLMCDRCRKLSGMYYEAVLQVRTKKDISRMLPKKRDILKIDRLKNGYDVFIMKRGLARKIIKELKSLNFNIKESYKLLGKGGGKKIYRCYYSIRD
ncbi:MAG: NMD3-related protein [Candidatus Aenigmatarchaeota archaeon]